MSSPFRTKFTDGAIGNLSNRWLTYRNLSKNMHYVAATRNPAWCKVEAGGASVPVDTTTFEQTYTIGDFRRPDPMLKNLTLIQNGEGGTGLMVEAEATIQCHTRAQFQYIESKFCRTGKEVTIRWGYRNPRGLGYSSKTIKGFTITTFSFNTTQEGFWIVTFKALAPAMAAKEIIINNKIKQSPKPRNFKLNDSKSYPVTNLIELITYWAQSNGTTAIDAASNGQVSIPDMGKGALVIYTPDHLYSKDKNSGKPQSGDASNNNETSKTNNIVYLTLETIFEMFNNELLPEYAAAATDNTKKEFENLKYKFHPTYSFSYVDPQCRSAYPTRVLILGPNISNYKNSAGLGKDFLEGVSNPGAITAFAGTAEKRNKIDLKKILIERSLVLSALGASIKEPHHAEKLGPKVNDEGSKKVKDFFSEISQIIKEATGDAISLVLSMAPEFYTENSESNVMYIFDENSGLTTGQDVWVFDPIDGDGTTRTCEIKSEAGSELMQSSAFSSAYKSNDPIAEAQGQMENGTTKGRQENYEDALDKIEKIIYEPGVLGDSAFDETHMQALRDQLSAIRYGAPNSKTVDLNLYPGIGISISLDGIWGIHPGCGIWTTQMPNKYKTAKSFFWVTTVTHTFSGDSSDWETKVEGILTNHTNPRYIGEQRAT